MVKDGVICIVYFLRRCVGILLGLVDLEIFKESRFCKILGIISWIFDKREVVIGCMEGRVDDRFGCWKVEVKKLLKVFVLLRGEDNFILLCIIVVGIEFLLVLVLKKD